MIGKKAQVNVVTINPKCLSLLELYGEFNFTTMEWKDGFVSCMFRKFSDDSNKDVVQSKSRNDSKESYILTLTGKKKA